MTDREATQRITTDPAWLTSVTAVKPFVRRVEARLAVLRRWWKAQTPRWQLAILIAGLFAVAGTLNLVSVSLVRANATRPVGGTSASASSVPVLTTALTSEAAPPDAGRAWGVVGVWQGKGSSETPVFTVGGHWRVDWIFSPSQPDATLQVYVFQGDGRLLLNLAANTQSAGPNTSFWAGPGRYFLRVNSTGGDWKLDVQDLH